MDESQGGTGGSACRFRLSSGPKAATYTSRPSGRRGPGQSVVNGICFEATNCPSTYRLKLADCAPRVDKLINPPKLGGGPVPAPFVKCPPAGKVPDADQVPFSPVVPATVGSGRLPTA